MKGLLYTLVLTAVLVVSVVFFQSLRQERPGEPMRTPAEPPSPMAVQSAPAERTHLDPEVLEQTNQEALYRTGIELLDLWHVPEAIEVFETLVGQDSVDTEAYLRLVECYAHPTVGDEKRAGERWQRAAMLSQGADTVWVSGFYYLFVEPAPAEAVERFSASVEQGGHEVESRLLLATALLEDGRPDTARRYVKDLLDGDPSLGRARELLVRCQVAQGRYDDALASAKELAAMYPEEVYPYVLLSRVELMMGRIDEAVEFCNNALRLDHRYVPAIVARAHLYVAEGETEAARVGFEKLQLFDDPVLASVGIEGTAYVDFISGRFDEATHSMDEAIRRAMAAGAPRRGLFYAFRLVDYLCELGRTDAAEAVLDRWVSRHGKVPNELGRLRISISKARSRDVPRALDRAAKDRDWRAWMRTLAVDPVDMRALLRINSNDYAGALDVLEGAKAVRSPGTRREYLTGFALFRSGRAEEAQGYFEQARYRLNTLVFPYHGDPILSVQSVFFLAETALARGDSAAARQFYTQFLRYWQDADWDLQAVKRARRKLAALPESPASGS